MKGLRKMLPTALQALIVLLMALGTCLAAYLLCFGAVALVMAVADASAKGLWLGLFTLLAMATVIGVSVCCYRALGAFYGLCRRMKTGTAFTEENCRALTKVARSCAWAAGWVLPVVLILAASILGTPVRNWLYALCVNLAIPFAFLTVALMFQAVHLLMRRALRLQQDSDLTV